METQTLELFLAVAEAESFAAVARRWNMDPSQVSRQIAALEQELGFRLFQRSTRRLALTAAGAEYRERIGEPLAELQQALRQGREANQQVRGSLRLTCSVAFGHSLLLPLLPGFRQQYPLLELELVFSDAVLDLFSERIDLAIRHGPAPTQNLVGFMLFPVQYRVCASAEYLRQSPRPQQPQDLEQHPCVVFPYPGYRQRWWFRRQAEANPAAHAVQRAIVINNALGVLQACRLGMGPALLANWLADAAVQRGELIDLFPDYQVSATDFSDAVWLLYPSRRALPMKTRVFIDYLRAHYGLAAGLSSDG